MTEELIARLSKVRGLSAIAHRSVSAYENKGSHRGDVARALNVQTILEGTVALNDDRVVADLRFVDAATSEPLWVQQYNAALVDVPAVQRNIAERIAAALQIAIGSIEPGLVGQGKKQSRRRLPSLPWRTLVAGEV